MGTSERDRRPISTSRDCFGARDPRAARGSREPHRVALGRYCPSALEHGSWRRSAHVGIAPMTLSQGHCPHQGRWTPRRRSAEGCGSGARPAPHSVHPVGFVPPSRRQLVDEVRPHCRWASRGRGRQRHPASASSHAVSSSVSSVARSRAIVSWRSARIARLTVSSMLSWRSAAKRVTNPCVFLLIRIVVVSPMMSRIRAVDGIIYKRVAA